MIARGPACALLALSALVGAPPPAPPPADTVAIVVDANARRHPISPYIYGVNFADAVALADLGATVNRSGGNSASLYDWRGDARQAGRDWFFETLPCTPDDLFCFTGNRFVAATRGAGAAAMLTVPIGGWVARGGARRAAFSVARYGPQRHADPAFPDAGDGIRPDGRPITGNDPHDAARPSSVADQRAWLGALVGRWGGAAGGGVRFYALDNEPSLWYNTHRATHPVGATGAEIARRTIAYAGAIRAADPAARILAPEEWGWNGYRYSGFDQQHGEAHGLADPPDRRAMGGMDYLPWLLTRWKAAGHPVDIVSVHWYPQGGEYRDGPADLSPGMQALRNRSTRTLWDPAYRDESWIATPVALIPRLRGWVDRYYHPGTPIALTEYNWGADDAMNGATAQADLLGIFGREGLYLATRWIVPPRGSPTWLAMKLFRNADGHGAGFGDTSIAATAPDPDTLSCFAALRTGGAMTLVAINKRADRPARIAVALRNFAGAGTLGGFRVAAGRLTPLPPARYRDGRLMATLPAQSITMFVLAPH